MKSRVIEIQENTENFGGDEILIAIRRSEDYNSHNGELLVTSSREEIIALGQSIVQTFGLLPAIQPATDAGRLVVPTLEVVDQIDVETLLEFLLNVSVADGASMRTVAEDLLKRFAMAERQPEPIPFARPVPAVFPQGDGPEAA